MSKRYSEYADPLVGFFGTLLGMGTALMALPTQPPPLAAWRGIGAALLFTVAMLFLRGLVYIGDCRAVGRRK